MPKSAVHSACLALVWVTVASSSLVAREPAPVDLLTCVLIVALPAAGLVAFRPVLLVLAGISLLIAAAGFAAAGASLDIEVSSIHTAVTLYLCAAAFVFAGFIARSPAVHTRLILNAYMAAAIIAAALGVGGFFDFWPDANLTTKFGRASGPFKDPNVYGPFLVPALLYAVNSALTRAPGRSILALGACALLGLALLLSFSRGAWFNALFALTVYAYGAFVLSPTDRGRAKVLVLPAAALAIGSGLVVAALEFDGVAELLGQRAQLTQSYDVGPEGRFGGQSKALGLAAENPLGIGALHFGMAFHSEDVHDVYLSMFLNAGWLGGLLYLALCIATAIAGCHALVRRGEGRELLLVAYPALLATLLQGLAIDTDHWRHLYLLLAIVWGFMAAPSARRSARPGRAVGAALARERPATLRRSELGATRIARAARTLRRAGEGPGARRSRVAQLGRAARLPAV